MMREALKEVVAAPMQAMAQELAVVSALLRELVGYMKPKDRTGGVGDSA